MRHLSATLLIFIWLLSHQSVGAQGNHPFPYGKAPGLPLTPAAGQAGNSGPAPAGIRGFIGARATGTGSRLTALYAGYGTAAGVTRNSDSSHNTFSGTRGGDLDQEVKADNTTNYKWDTLSNSWRVISQYNNTYDAANNRTQQVYQTWNGAAWVNSSRYLYHYDAAGLDTDEVAEIWDASALAWKPSYRYRSTYSGGQLAALTFNTWSAATSSYSVPNSRFTYTYNASGGMTSELAEQYSTSTSSFANYYRYLYTYDAANRLTLESYETWSTVTSAWLHNFRFFFYYNTAGQEVANTGQTGISNGTLWANQDSTYDVLDATGNAVMNQLYHWQGSPAGWVYTSRNTNAFYGPGKLSTQLVEIPSGASFVNSARYFYAYNSFGQLTRIYGQKWDGTAWVINNTTQDNRYYYENYNGVGIAGTPWPDAIKVLLYPVPASQTLEMSIQFMQPADFTATITDAAGKVAAQWQDAGAGRYIHTVDARSWTAGIYYLSIRSGANKATQAFSVQH